MKPLRLCRDDSFDSIVREWRMTSKKLQMTQKQLSTIPSSHPKHSELQSSIEPVRDHTSLSKKKRSGKTDRLLFLLPFSISTYTEEDI